MLENRTVDGILYEHRKYDGWPEYFNEWSPVDGSIVLSPSTINKGSASMNPCEVEQIQDSSDDEFESNITNEKKYHRPESIPFDLSKISSSRKLRENSYFLLKMTP